jgi:hypothetical protein
LAYIGRTPTGSILTGADIADGSISTAKLADTAVSTAKIADDAVGNTKLNLASDYAFTGTITGTPKGLTLVHSSNSTSDASSFSIDNIFTATYTNYLVIMEFDRDDTAGSYMRLLKSDGTERTSSYFMCDYGHRTNSSSMSVDGNNNVSTFYINRDSGSEAGMPSMFWFNFYKPFISTANTTIYGSSFSYDDANNAFKAHTLIGMQDVTETARGFKIVANSGNVTDYDVKVYGYSNA